jgi:hypothetical protein
MTRLSLIMLALSLKYWGRSDEKSKIQLKETWEGRRKAEIRNQK